MNKQVSIVMGVALIFIHFRLDCFPYQPSNSTDIVPNNQNRVFLLGGVSNYIYIDTQRLGRSLAKEPDAESEAGKKEKPKKKGAALVCQKRTWG